MSPFAALIPSLILGSVTPASDRVADLTFKDTRFLTRSLADFPSAKAIVLVFLDTGCPVARYGPTLKKLEGKYRGKGVQFVALFPGAEDTIAGLAAFSVKHDLAFPCGKDYDAAMATALGVTRTPEVVVLDAERRARYRGRIDDQYRPGGALPKPIREELREAVEDVLAGRETKSAVTTVDGCPITVPPAAPDRRFHFAEHVAPIFAKHCQECHRPGTVAPFSLIEYSQVKARAKAIAEVVRDGSMPPWYGARISANSSTAAG